MAKTKKATKSDPKTLNPKPIFPVRLATELAARLMAKKPLGVVEDPELNYGRIALLSVAEYEVRRSGYATTSSGDRLIFESIVIGTAMIEADSDFDPVDELMDSLRDIARSALAAAE